MLGTITKGALPSRSEFPNAKTLFTESNPVRHPLKVPLIQGKNFRLVVCLFTDFKKLITSIQILKYSISKFEICLVKERVGVYW